VKFSLDLGESRIKEVDYGLLLFSFQLLGTKDLENLKRNPIQLIRYSDKK
jgi:hypothetical protein